MSSRMAMAGPGNRRRSGGGQPRRRWGLPASKQPSRTELGSDLCARRQRLLNPVLGTRFTNGLSAREALTTGVVGADRQAILTSGEPLLEWVVLRGKDPRRPVGRHGGGRSKWRT